MSVSLELLDLEPMPFRLGYGIPLVVLSVAIAGGGAFLALDRTRSFAPLSVGTATNKKVVYRLEGGVGGLIAGWAFGVHLCTFLVLVIVNVGGMRALTTVEFVVVWALGGVATALLAGRWRAAALVALGLTGGAALGLALAVLVHPPLLPRQIFMAVFTPILTGLTLVPGARIGRPAARAAAALSGAFGIIVGAAVMGNIPAWANVWSRLWVKDSIEWGTGTEHGLSAAFWVLVALGAGTDWFLRRRFGENPDQRWDSYLAHYAASLPTRAGTFEPHTTWFQRFLAGPQGKEPIAFEGADADEQVHLKPFSSPLAKGKLRAKARSRGGGKGGPVKFSPLAQDLSSDSESGGSDLDKKPPRPFAARAASSATSVTAVSERARGKQKADDDHDEYSDAEAALPVLRKNQSPPRGAPGWKPAFLARADGAASPPLPPAGAVPATPSLLQAINRIHAAQETAYGSAPQSPTRSPDEPQAPAGWQGFWREVQTKATESDTKKT